MIDENVAPTPRPNVDFASLSPPPTPEQYFLLSRIDGRLTVAKLCMVSGLGRTKTLQALEALALAGAIELPGFVARTLTATSEASVGNASRPADKGARGKVVPHFPVPPSRFNFDERLLAADVPLDIEHRREVICLYEQLASMTCYDLFGVDRSASKSSIKKAYFRLSKRYHPDTFFRMDTGAFGPMLETVFKAMTEAYRTLSNKRRRQAYDAELDTQATYARPTSVASAQTSEASSAGAADSDVSEQNKRKAAALLLVRRAEKMQAAGDYTAAAAEYRRALALNRNADLAMRVATTLLDEAHMADESCSFARAALKLGAPEDVVRMLMGRALEAEGASDSALKQYRKVLALVPGHQRARDRLEALSEKS